MNAAIIIAEIGCNHKGKFDIAKEAIRMAKIFCQVDIVKFQKRTPKELLSEKEYNTPHSVPYHSYGQTYGEHREKLEFTIEQHMELKRYCEELGITYSSSVWDMTAAQQIVSLKPTYIKIPSASNTRFEMLEFICEKHPNQIHVSLGMTTHKEEEEIVDFFIRKKRNKDLVLYACTSAYPVEDEDVCLLEITRLREKYSECIHSIGFSGHHRGIAIDVAAFILGTQWIERHFTLDRTWKGSDHAASLEPDGLRRLTRDIRCIAKTLQYKPKEILEVEQVQRNKLKWSRNNI